MKIKIANFAPLFGQNTLYSEFQEAQNQQLIN